MMRTRNMICILRNSFHWRNLVVRRIVISSRYHNKYFSSTRTFFILKMTHGTDLTHIFDVLTRKDKLWNHMTPKEPINRRHRILISQFLPLFWRANIFRVSYIYWREEKLSTTRTDIQITFYTYWYAVPVKAGFLTTTYKTFDHLDEIQLYYQISYTSFKNKKYHNNEYFSHVFPIF